MCLGEETSAAWLYVKVNEGDVHTYFCPIVFAFAALERASASCVCCVPDSVSDGGEKPAFVKRLVFGGQRVGEGEELSAGADAHPCQMSQH